MKQLCSLAIGLILFSAPITTLAQQKRVELSKQKSRGAGEQLQKSNQTALPSANTSVISNSVKDLQLVKPPKTSTFFENTNDDQSQLEMITDRQINEMYKLTQKFQKSPNRGEMWLRLAELYVEKASIIDMRKQSEYERNLIQFQNGQRKTKPVLNLKDAQEYNRKAIQLYEWFVRDFPNDPKMDQALFFLGYNNFEIGELKRGTYYYDQLTKRYPTSAFLIESHFALAEYYFENENWRPAKENYSRVVKSAKHRLTPFSIYKLAWCEFRLGNTPVGIKYLERLIQVAKSQDVVGAGGRQLNRNRLESEALRDLVLFYADDGDPGQAPAYFEKMAGNNSRDYLEKLAYHYGDKGNLQGAKEIFTYLILKEPNSPKSFDYQYQIVKILSTAKKPTEFKDELLKWIQTYSAQSSWSRANAKQKEIVDNANNLRESTLRNYILQQHQTAQNSRAPFSQNLAKEGYQVYLREFKGSVPYWDMQFYYGELLFDMGQFLDSAAAYRAVSEVKDSKFQSRANENILYALEKALPSEKQMAERAEKTNEPIPLSAEVMQFIEASEKFLTANPQAEKVPEVKFRIGRIYYLHNQFSKADPYFKDIVKNHPKTKYSEYAANLLLDSFNLRKDYAGLEKTGRELLEDPNIQGSKAGQDIRNVVEKAQFKRAQDLELSKDYHGSANEFSIFAAQNAGSALAAAALFNAAINYERAGDVSESIEHHQKLAAAGNSQSYRASSHKLLAQLYMKTGRFAEAAPLFASAARENPKDPLRANMIFNSALLYEAVGQDGAAEKQYQEHLSLAKGADRLETLWRLGEMNQNLQKKSKAIEYYDQYFNQSPLTQKKIDSAERIAILSGEIGKQTQRADWALKATDQYRKAKKQGLAVNPPRVGETNLRDASLLLKQIQQTQIPNDPAQQQKVLEKKISTLKQLNQSLAPSVQSENPEDVVNALFMLGAANETISSDFINAPPPKSITPDQLPAYREGLGKLAQPFREAAISSFEKSVQSGSDSEAYTESYRLARKKLNSLKPGSLPESENFILDAQMKNWSLK